MNHSKLRILLTVPHLHSTQSPYREMMAMSRYLPRDDFELTICSLRKNGYEETAPELQKFGVSCFVASFRPRGKTISRILGAVKEQRSIDRKGPFDIQHSLDFTSSPFEAFMATRRRRKFVFSQRNMNEGGSDRLLRMKARLADKIIAISGPVRNFLISRGVNVSKIELIHNGFDFDHSVSVQDRKPVILSVGHLERRKRHEDAVRALAAVVEKVPEAELRIAGKVHDETYFSELKNLIEELKLEGKVQFLGVRTDVLELMSRSSVLLHCAESEAFGWVIVEAMSTGLPVICSDVDGPREIIDHGKTGMLVSTGDVRGYSEAIIRVMSEPGLRDRLSAEAMQNVKMKFSAQRMVESTARLYRELAIRGTLPG